MMSEPPEFNITWGVSAVKAVVMQDAALEVKSLADPEPGPGEALEMEHE